MDFRELIAARVHENLREKYPILPWSELSENAKTGYLNDIGLVLDALYAEGFTIVLSPRKREPNG